MFLATYGEGVWAMIQPLFQMASCWQRHVEQAEFGNDMAHQIIFTGATWRDDMDPHWYLWRFGNLRWGQRDANAVTVPKSQNDRPSTMTCWTNGSRIRLDYSTCASATERDGVGVQNSINPQVIWHTIWCNNRSCHPIHQESKRTKISSSGWQQPSLYMCVSGYPSTHKTVVYIICHHMREISSSGLVDLDTSRHFRTFLETPAYILSHLTARVTYWVI